MRKLLVLDSRNYDADLPEILRISIRGVIFADDKLLLIESDFGELKLPGGGQEAAETDIDTLVREVREETGYSVIPASASPFGEVEEKRLSTKEPMIWHQISRLYFCNVEKECGACSYTESEKKHGFHPVWCSLEDALETDREMIRREGVRPWNQREYRTLRLIWDERKGNPG